MKNVAQS